MARQATGQVIERERKGGTVYALRFTAGGERRFVTLGTRSEGWDRKRAETELANVLADVRRGQWTPPAPVQAPTIASDPGFHRFATDWLDARRGELRPNTLKDYEWALTWHLLPFFKRHTLSQITVAEVDRYRASKVNAATPLAAISINKTITRLSQIMETAVEYGHVERNPARGRRRRVKATRTAPVWLDSAEQIGALLEGAAALDYEHPQTPRRAILATLVFAGLRISELEELRWRDVDLAAGRLTVRESKTDAGMREVDLLPALVDVLREHKAATLSTGGNVTSLDAARALADARVFGTRTGKAHSQANVRERMLAPAVERASAALVASGASPLPDGLTPHKLRHTFASVLVALGTDPAVTMAQLGHADPAFTLRVYTHGMRRSDAERSALRELVGIEQTAPKGTNAQKALAQAAES